MCYIISFGDSNKYRLPFVESGNRDIEKVREDITSYLKGKFPGFAGLKYLDKIKLEKVDDTAARAYPELNASSLGNIEKLLGRETKVAEAVKNLDSDAPWSNIKI
ncbi:MAG: hypothetical protein K2M87_07550 [Muribaculaceae bacterium]|nr:hypothetical protein [Muribaculaceae bacterium]